MSTAKGLHRDRYVELAATETTQNGETDKLGCYYLKKEEGWTGNTTYKYPLVIS